MAVFTEVQPRLTARLSDWAGPLVAVLLFALVALVCAEFGIDPTKTHFGEDGLVERSTPSLLALTCVLYLLWKERIGARSWVPSLILGLMVLRELDADRWLTNKSLLSTGYYFDNAGVGYGERILVGVIVGALGVASLQLIWRSRSDIRSAVSAFQPYCRSLLLGVFLVGASQILDGLGRTYKGLTGGVPLPHEVHALAGIFEETSELAMAAMFLVALLQLRFDPARNALPGRSAAS